MGASIWNPNAFTSVTEIGIPFNLIPYQDNYYDIGSTALAWKTIYAYSGIFNDSVSASDIIATTIKATTTLQRNNVDVVDVNQISAYVETNAIRTVNSIADLRSLDKTKFPVVVVTGYYISGDGGGNCVYFYDSGDITSVDNGGSIIVGIDGGRWKLIQTNGLLNVKAFGAKGDNITDDTLAIQTALSAAITLNLGGIYLPYSTYLISAEITWSTRSITIKGDSPKWGVTASSNRGSCLKWIGALGGTMVSARNGAQYATIENIAFDANDLANTCVGFLTTGGVTAHQVDMPKAQNLHFTGYRGAAVVFGNPDTSVLDSGQMQQALIEHCAWWGGGATATVTNVFAITLNAQNCEILHVRNCFFDPYTAVGGGPNINHQNHIKVRAGGINILGVTFTRSDDNNIYVISDGGVVVNHVRTEDPKLLRIDSTYPSNPISISNVEGRDGGSTGTDDFITITAGGGQSIELNNIHSTGNIKVSGVDDNRVTTNNINFKFPTVSSFQVTGGTPYIGKYDIRTDPGKRVLYNTNAIETWYDSSTVTLFRNDRGRLRINSLQATTAANDAKNFGGAFSISNANTSATITFSTAEVDANYYIVCTPLGQIGTPAAGSNRVLSISRLAASFTVQIEVAPGVGNSVSFSWILFRA